MRVEERELCKQARAGSRSAPAARSMGFHPRDTRTAPLSSRAPALFSKPGDDSSVFTSDVAKTGNALAYGCDFQPTSRSPISYRTVTGRVTVPVIDELPSSIETIGAAVGAVYVTRTTGFGRLPAVVGYFHGVPVRNFRPSRIICRQLETDGAVRVFPFQFLTGLQKRDFVVCGKLDTGIARIEIFEV